MDVGGQARSGASDHERDCEHLGASADRGGPVRHHVACSHLRSSDDLSSDYDGDARHDGGALIDVLRQLRRCPRRQGRPRCAGGSRATAPPWTETATASLARSSTRRSVVRPSQVAEIPGLDPGPGDEVSDLSAGEPVEGSIGHLAHLAELLHSDQVVERVGLKVEQLRRCRHADLLVVRLCHSNPWRRWP